MVTRDQAAMLAALAAACRQPGKRRWDEAGVIAALAKVAHLQLADVIHVTIRAAEDPDLDTPGAIGNTSSPTWGHYLSQREIGKRAPKFDPRTPGERCSVCREREGHWRHPDDHPFEPDFRDPNLNPTNEVAHLRGLIRGNQPERNES